MVAVLIEVGKKVFNRNSKRKMKDNVLYDNTIPIIDCLRLDESFWSWSLVLGREAFS